MAFFHKKMIFFKEKCKEKTGKGALFLKNLSLKELQERKLKRYHARLQQEQKEKENRTEETGNKKFSLKDELKRLIKGKNSRKLIISAGLAFALVVPYTGYAVHKLISVDAAADAVVTKAESRIGSRYVYGACHSYAQLRNRNQRAFDCSGLVNWSYYQSGNSIGLNTSSTLRRRGHGVSYRNLRAGDIVLFPHHAGVYIGNGRMVHAPNSRSHVKVSAMGGYWHRNFRGGRRIISRGFIQKRNRRTLHHTYKKPAALKNRYRKYTAGTYKITMPMNVRKAPSVNAGVAGYIAGGKTVYAGRIVNGHWGMIRYHGASRYVSLKYAHKIGQPKKTKKAVKKHNVKKAAKKVRKHNTRPIKKKAVRQARKTYAKKAVKRPVRKPVSYKKVKKAKQPVRRPNQVNKATYKKANKNAEAAQKIGNTEKAGAYKAEDARTSITRKVNGNSADARQNA